MFIKHNIQQNFNTITNLFIITILLFGGLVWADTNGIWHYATDIRSGIFGADEDGVGGGFSFISDVTFNADVNLNNVSNCAGKLITEPDGTIYCGVDNVNDADADSTNELQVLSINDHTISLSNSVGNITMPDNVNDADYVVGNEYPVAGTGISVTSNKTVNVDTSYVQRRVSSSCAVGSSIREINVDGSVVCETDDSGGIGNNCYWTGWDNPTMLDFTPSTLCNSGYAITGVETKIDTISLGFAAYDTGVVHKYKCCK